MTRNPRRARTRAQTPRRLAGIGIALAWALLGPLGCTEELQVLGPELEPGPEPIACSCDEREVCSANGCVERSDLVSLGLGYRYSCRILHGVLECWGENTYGQLGDNYPAASEVPQRVDADDDWLTVDGADEHTCAVKSPGQLYCWGGNKGGQLGVGDNSLRRMPTRVDDAEQVLRVSCGGQVTCAIQRNGGLYCWGTNVQRLFPDTGDVAEVIIDTPVRVLADSMFRRVSLGVDHGCAIRSDGALLCWGDNRDGQVGIEGALAVEYPMRVGDDEWYEVAAGSRHTCAIRKDNALYCWGSNDSLQLGLGSSMRERRQPTRVGADYDWQRLSAGESHTCGIRGEEAYCWGANGHGQLGQWASDPLGQPTLVEGGRAFEQIAVGQSHSCALEDDEAYCWGNNSDGQLGVGGTGPRFTPTAVP